MEERLQRLWSVVFGPTTSGLQLECVEKKLLTSCRQKARRGRGNWSRERCDLTSFTCEAQAPGAALAVSEGQALNTQGPSKTKVWHTLKLKALKLDLPRWFFYLMKVRKRLLCICEIE